MKIHDSRFRQQLMMNRHFCEVDVFDPSDVAWSRKHFLPQTEPWINRDPFNEHGFTLLVSASVEKPERDIDEEITPEDSETGSTGVESYELRK